MKDIVEQAGAFFNAFYGAPGYVLVAAVCVVIGYILRLNKTFPNAKIPIVCVLAGAILNPLCDAVGDTGKEAFRIWIVRNVLIGVVVGFCAWMFHNLILKRIEEKIPLLGPALKRVDAELEPTNSETAVPPSPEK